jgi:hypothetical protein
MSTVKVKIQHGIEAAGKFPFGFMTKENKEFLESNVEKEFAAKRESINHYKLDAVLPSGKQVIVHVYNAFEL